MAGTLTSIGYDGSVDEYAWVPLSDAVGGYGVATASSWGVTGVPNVDRTVSIAPGIGYGRGVRDEAALATTLGPLPAAGSGSLWHMIVARRNWDTNTTSFEYVAGTAARALPNRNLYSVTGNIDDQPLALVQVTNNVQTPTGFVDLRVKRGVGGAVGHDPLVLKYLTEPGSTVRIGDDLWYRDELGVERRHDLAAPRLHAIGGTLSGGTPPANASYREQIGYSVVSTNVNGDIDISFPVPFPNGLAWLDVELMGAIGVDNPVSAYLVTFSPNARTSIVRPDRTHFVARVFHAPSNTPYVGATFGINYRAIGW